MTGCGIGRDTPEPCRGHALGCVLQMTKPGVLDRSPTPRDLTPPWDTVAWERLSVQVWTDHCHHIQDPDLDLAD